MTLIADSTSWTNPIAVATLVLAAATASLAVFTFLSVRIARRSLDALSESADATLRVADAAVREAEATERSVALAGENMRRELRPYLIEHESVAVEFDGSGTVCRAGLINVGGLALIKTVYGQASGDMRAAPDLTWHHGTVTPRAVPTGAVAAFNGRSGSTASEDPNTRTPPTVYVRVSYTDLAGEQEATTYLCIRETRNLGGDDVWKIVGVAVVAGGGEPVRSGEGWNGFMEEVGETPWPSRL